MFLDLLIEFYKLVWGGFVYRVVQTIILFVLTAHV